MAELYAIDDDISIGRMKPCNVICEGISEISALHLKINRDTACMDVHGKNGVYLNGKFIRYKDSTKLEFADTIELFGVRILWLNNMIAIDYDLPERSTEYSNYKSDQDDGSKITLSVLLNKIDISNISNFIPADISNKSDFLNYNLFTKAPRTFYSIKNQIIELEAPPEKHEEEKQPIITTIGPAFTMALPMLMGFFVSRVASKNAGSGAFMYTGVVTAISSALLGVTWASINIRNRRQQQIINEQKRKLKYKKYVRACETRIKEQYNRNTSNLRLMYPHISEYVLDGINNNLLWNRNRMDEDFLKIRIGTANLPCDLDVRIPKDRLSLVDDELKELPKRLKTKYSWLVDVPETIDLREDNCVGIVCESMTAREELFLELIMMIAVSISPEDIAISCDFSSISEHTIEAIRFLPHLEFDENNFGYFDGSDGYGKNRKLSEDKYHVVFTDDFKKHNEGHQSGDQTCYIVISDRFEILPSICKLIIQKEPHFSGYLKISKDKSLRRSVHFDKVSVEEASRISRTLCGINRVKEKTIFELPDKVSFLELYESEITIDEIERRWMSSDTRIKIEAPIGISESGEALVLDLHEKDMGPHGLIAGTTGSGKSEILQTIILSLMVNYSPRDVGFFLIDYKGGGMATLFGGVPHIMGSISNLSGRMIIRAMASVKSENERRQRIFAYSGVNNISEYQDMYKNGHVNEALPHIFIVIDEFAELKKEEPEFMKELISVARVGRSLGIHLILATQKPAGVVDDNILSNSRFRICLRVQDRMDSMEMLRKPDAADIMNPGRAILQVGNDELYTWFQSAYTMDKSLTHTKKRYIKVTDSKGNEYKSRNTRRDEDISQEPQLIRTLSKIIGAESNMHEHINPLWLPPLKDNIYKGPPYENISLGIYDNPKHQEQKEVEISLFDIGNTLILGGIQSGKSTLLTTIALSFLRNTKCIFYHIYYIDFSSQILATLKHSKMCGGYINEDNIDDTSKLFVMLSDIMSLRKEKLRGGNFRQFFEKNKDKENDYMAPIIVFIDGLAQFRELTGQAFDRELETFLKNSEVVGIYFFISAYSLSSQEVSRKMFESIKTCIPLQLKDKYEYKDALRTTKGDFELPESIKGRGLIQVENEICEFQAYQCIEATDDFERYEKLVTEIDDLNTSIEERFMDSLNEYLPQEIPVIPSPLTIKSFINEISRKTKETQSGIPIGFFLESGKIFCLPYDENLVVLISGHAGAGKSNMLKLIHLMTRDIETNEFVISVGECLCEGMVLNNGMKIIVYDEKSAFNVTSEIKKWAGPDPYVIHLGGGLDKQNLADYSYIPYSQQIQIKSKGVGIVRKTMRGNEYGEIIVPYVE